MVNGTPDKPSQTRFIGGIRALLALTVVLSHAEGLAMIYTRHFGFTHPFAPLLWLGQLAVPAFITVSGFVLAYPVAKAGSLEGGAVKFYLRRVRRILPAYYFSVAFAFLVAVLITHTASWVEWAGDQFISTALLTNDLTPLFHAAQRPDWNDPLWSLPIEWHIYMFFPALIWAWCRFGVGKATAGAICFTAALIALTHRYGMGWAQPWLWTNFVFGSAAAWLVGSPSPKAAAVRQLPMRQIASYSAIAFLGLVFGAVGPMSEALGSGGNGQAWMGESLAGGLVAALLFVGLSTNHDSPEHRFLDGEQLRWVGERSYSLYLLHFPVLSATAYLLSRAIQGYALWAATFIVGLPIAVAFAHVSYTLIETRYLRSRSLEKLPRVPTHLLEIPAVECTSADAATA